MCKTGHTDKESDRSVYANDICKPLPLVAGKIFVRVFFDGLSVRIATESAFSYERCTEEISILCQTQE